VVAQRHALAVVLLPLLLGWTLVLASSPAWASPSSGLRSSLPGPLAQTTEPSPDPSPSISPEPAPATPTATACTADSPCVVTLDSAGWQAIATIGAASVFLSAAALWLGLRR